MFNTAVHIYAFQTFTKDGNRLVHNVLHNRSSSR